MHIVHLQHPYIPNMGYQENYLPAKQKELGHEVDIITTDIIPEKFHIDECKYKTGTYRYKDVPVHRCRSITYDTEAVTLPIGAIKKIREINPDVIHSHRLISFLSICTLATDIFSDSTVVFDIHIDNDNFHLDKLYKKMGFNMFRYLSLPLIKHVSDGFIAVNPYAQRFLKTQLGIENSYLLSLGADTELFYPSSQERQETRFELGIKGEFTMITAGNLNQSKNIEKILRSLADIEDESIQFIILGDGPEEYIRHLRSVVDDLNLSEQVIFHDFVDHDDLSKYYNAADIGIWPGKLGITILEAISCGLPIIVEDSEATEFLVENENGITLPEPSPNQIMGAIQRYLHNPHLQKQHSQNAFELAQEKLSWDSIANQSIEIYNTR